MKLFELGRNRVERVAAGAHDAIELLLSAIEQVLRLENQTPPAAPHAIKLIFGVRADPFARLFARLWSEQNRQANTQPEAQQQCPDRFSFIRHSAFLADFDLTPVAGRRRPVVQFVVLVVVFAASMSVHGALQTFQIVNSQTLNSMMSVFEEYGQENP
jgi:hypothetical protein